MQSHRLKRTISKCVMEDESSHAVACKKVSFGLENEPILLPRERPLHEVEPELSPTDVTTTTFLLPSTIRSEFAAIKLESHESHDEISATRMLSAILDYLRDMAHICNCAIDFSFAQLRHMLQSIPFAVGQMQHLVKTRLELSWPLAVAFVQNVSNFITDEDIRDASVSELVTFLQVYLTTYPVVAGNICANLLEFFRDILTQFKHFLTLRWLQSGKITFPCEFGHKSDSLFLCMECHREHW
ncbi:uncharacterized protein PHALS_12185 [Plasmopara halstedii]|uniref:Uncharacterized protein n=1 Tax=Plasmopara halstedii TaxID=4781 RepID=A0A0P1ALM5_PLAHL|nr:uncharacterized protein PHALS_12185 [Plasmopara halstedii]CEG41870.1 hypothetical protein PHALS_12185 [Plasmopara halstedii]|eukprot:XP_024578239.1 hypothetical protein PHALS_12185 [Plasmopara halstedii]